RFRFICPSFVRPDSKSFWRKFLGAGQGGCNLNVADSSAAPRRAMQPACRISAPVDITFE
ncbi:hypothetical protein, partial [Bradyrhizobium sp. SZCCHNRI3052]|uniref:hypothetical protein n=1 Tax=Bradyrhizobium sp. SZCCHNRI3052 TaxID=3057295 RepID=UPI002916AC9D